MRRHALFAALVFGLLPTAAEAFMPLDTYSNDTHLAAEDGQLFAHADRSQLTAHRRARQDVVRDLQAKDNDADDLENDFAAATVTSCRDLRRAHVNCVSRAASQG